MRNLIEFLLKYSSAFLFTLLFIVSMAFLLSQGRFHSSIWFTSANALSSKVYGISNDISGYFNLKSINASLQESNALLQSEVLNLRSEVAMYKALANDTVLEKSDRYGYILATVLNNSVTKPRNYFSIDKGTVDGVKAGMGVIDQNGIVGIVNISGPNTSRVLSVLNSSQHISVRLKSTNIVGSLVWKNNDPSIAYMEEVQRHSVFHVGDTVVTSGYSSAFPADIPVGIVLGKIKSDNDNYFVLKVKLMSNFSTLSAVRVLKDIYKEELDSLELHDI